MPRKQNVTNKQFQKFLVYVGCSLKRAHGDHFIYSRPDLLRPIIIPLDNPLPQFIIKNNIDLLGISWTEFFKIMEEL